MGAASFQRGPRVRMMAKIWRVMVLHPGEIHDPVPLPVSAAVDGEGLLPARRLRRDAPPDEAHTDGVAIAFVVAVERADAIAEAADDRRPEAAGRAAVEPVDRPQIRRRVVGAQAHALVRAARYLDVVFVGVAVAVEDLARHARSVEFEPVVAVGQSPRQVTMTACPDSHEEVEIRTGFLLGHGGLLRPPYYRPLLSAPVSMDRAPPARGRT